ncbi:hypothetical protein [Plebeiibacterium marinum]|uniref:Uncharacterized protein n=1 Tax=Plebeiibacterium marinum TaxID=2992111 RepID=A0AAE3SMN7_9BACT|nr:hypothetical protein [Plebeiobacterium marinum]MCW3807745.1 hypothetical protein [Plebeiobacterium marinum]
MKQKIFLAALLFSFTSFVVAVAAPKDYFVGKWDVMVYGTIGGDEQMIIELKRVDGKLEGAIVGPTDDIKPFFKIEEKPDTVKVYFKHLFFKVNLQLGKKDDTHVTGLLQEKYEAKGVRIVKN